MVSGSPPGCLLAQRCFVWQGAHPSASPACLLLGQARPSPYSSHSSCVCAKPPATRRVTKTSQSLTSQQRPSVPSCPLRPQLFSPYSVEAPCFQADLLAVIQGCSSACFRTLALEILPTGLPSFLLCSPVTSFHDLFKIHLFQKKRKMKGELVVGSALIKAGLSKRKQQEGNAAGLVSNFWTNFLGSEGSLMLEIEDF